MRKYRMWNEARKEYIALDGRLGNTFWRDGVLETIQPYLVLEQFTGRKDKDGVEMYGGSKVQWDEKDDGGTYQEVGIIVWHNDGWKIEYRFDPEGEHKYPPEFWDFYDMPDIKVIGTIHDNEGDKKC